MMAAFLRFQKDPPRLVSRFFFCSSPPVELATSTPASTPHRLPMKRLKSEKNPDKILLMLHKYLDQKKPCSKFRLHFYDLSVRKLAEFKRFDLIEQALEPRKKKTQLLDDDSADEEGLLITIMKLYSSAQMLEQAVRTFDQMEELGYTRTARSICTLLSVYANNKQFDKVHELFSEIPEKFGVSLDVVAYNIVIKAFVGQKDFQSAFALLDKMESDGIKPNAVSYNTLLSGLIKDKNTEKFDEIFKQMEDNGVDSDVITYNYKMVSLCWKKESSKARELLDEMISKGIKPNGASFNIVIDGLCDVGDYESAKKALEYAASNNYPLNYYSYLTIINKSIHGKNFELAFEVCKMCLERNMHLNSKNVGGIIKNLLKNDKADKAKILAEEVKKKNLVDSDIESMIEMLTGLDGDSYNLSNAYFTVINNAIESEEFELALAICKKNIEDIPFATLEKLVNGLKKISKNDDAKIIVKEMQKKLDSLIPA